VSRKACRESKLGKEEAGITRSREKDRKGTAKQFQTQGFAQVLVLAFAPAPVATAIAASVQARKPTFMNASPPVSFVLDQALLLPPSSDDDSDADMLHEQGARARDKSVEASDRRTQANQAEDPVDGQLVQASQVPVVVPAIRQEKHECPQAPDG
jgi:hypothetical protein